MSHLLKKIKNLRALWSIHSFYSWPLFLLVSNTAVQKWEYLNILLCSTCTGLAVFLCPLSLLCHIGNFQGRNHLKPTCVLWCCKTIHKGSHSDCVWRLSIISHPIILSLFIAFSALSSEPSIFVGIQTADKCAANHWTTYLSCEIHSLIHKFHNSSTSALILTVCHTHMYFFMYVFSPV